MAYSAGYDHTSICGFPESSRPIPGAYPSMITSRTAPAPHAEDSEDVTAFSDFVQRHQRMVWRYLRLLGAEEDEADDLLQETFLRIDDSENIESPAAFLRSVARHLLLSARRAARRRPPTIEWTTAVDHLIARDPAMIEDVRIVALRDCVARLNDRARHAVELHYLQGQDFETVSQTLGLRHNGLKTLLARARQWLRDCLSHDTDVRRFDGGATDDQV